MLENPTPSPPPVEPRKSTRLFKTYVLVFVLAVVWVALQALGVPFIPVPPVLWPLFYAVLLIAIPLALLRVARWRFFGAGSQ
jgi:hypothetical protein